MHAAYSFLIDTDDKDEALACFDGYQEKHCDENNWWQAMAFITESGQAVNCADKGDRRGRDGFVENSKLLQMCEKVRFDWAKKFALECVVADMTAPAYLDGSALLTSNADMGYGDIISAIMQDVPPAIAKMYEDFKVGDTTFDLEGYRRKKLTETFELLLTAKVKPFATYPVSPYDYRCHDLRDGRESDNGLSILIVDIHT